MSSTITQSLTITKPDDFHHHFRDGPVVQTVVEHANVRFGKCLAMPNLKPPVTTTDMALAYKNRIMSFGAKFELVMTLYLTDNTPPSEVYEAHKRGIKAVKYYPAGATTNSDAGVTDVKKCYATLKAMEEVGMLLLIHSEVSHGEIDIFDREEVFIEEIMKPLVSAFPNLKIVMEHISTSKAVDFVTAAPPNVAASITCHHLLYNRNALLVGGVKPHFYCLPILKRERHRQALVQAAISGNPKFFAGTDSAPHPTSAKESACGCAGCYTAHAAVELYTEAFEKENALDKLEAFCSFHGSDFYGLPRNTEKITLQKQEWKVPPTYKFGQTTVTPLRANETVTWSIVVV